jgi:hypothetical protein
MKSKQYPHERVPVVSDSHRLPYRSETTAVAKHKPEAAGEPRAVSVVV